jgi:hypothetical protein
VGQYDVSGQTNDSGPEEAESKEDEMKFLCHFAWGADRQNQDEAIQRFRATGGQPPAGVKLLGRWTRADFTGGVVLVESDDSKALTGFALMWSDLMELEIVPVLEDQELLEVLTRAGR